jgi:hypothetical protein
VTGSAVENYNLDSGNAAPRGAASTAAGDKVWVVDNNRKVFVYDTSGGLLGSWTAGTLANNAQPQGIATNGTDVWIVDGKSDKVFKYTGAAMRLSGSQNANSNFALNSGNRSPTDIVTDGSHFWVTNNSSQDKVFKYTVAGALAGSWTISTSGASSPTGITIDPSNVSDIWIVDSATDRVYTYTGAASKTSGSQSAASSFALAAGNGNPQGIADPPVASSLVPLVTAPAPGEVDDYFAAYEAAPSRSQDRAATHQDPSQLRISLPARSVSEGSPAAIGASASNAAFLSSIIAIDRDASELEELLAEMLSPGLV